MTKETYSEKVAKRISRNVLACLAYNGMKRDRLEGFLGVGQSSVSQKLNGRRPWSVEDLCNIAEYFRMPVEWFFAEHDIREEGKGEKIR